MRYFNLAITMREHGVFRFKRFSVCHDRVSMKVGTDGVLLGAWADVSSAKTILDIGSGSGLIALMLAQRTSLDVIIDAVEISLDDHIQGKQNIEASPWRARITPFHAAIQDFKPAGRYDVIVANPPYFHDSLMPPDQKRAGVRHAVTLTLRDLLSASEKMLAPAGRLSVILPPEEAGRLTTAALSHHLFCVRKTVVHTRAEKPAERHLLELSSHQYAYTQNDLVMYDENYRPTDEYRGMTSEFYLKM